MTGETEPHMMEDDNSLAAEYVLGVQTSELRETLSQRLLSDSAFAAQVARWEDHLSPMNDFYKDVLPPAHIKVALFKRLFPDAEKKRGSFWNSLGLWRGLTAGALTLSAVLIGSALLGSQPVLTDDPLISVLQADTGTLRFTAFYQPGTNEIRLSKLEAEKAADRDFELWLIEADGTPQSMGIFTDTEKTRVTVSPEFVAKLNSGDILAVSIEPLGGSPTGAVTGPVIATGVSRVL